MTASFVVAVVRTLGVKEVVNHQMPADRWAQPFPRTGGVLNALRGR
jgi:hypothetical protein